MKKKLFFSAWLCLFLTQVKGQTLFDVAIGSSNQDRAFVDVALRKQFSETFRAGIEVQTSLADYRFIGAKVIDEGVSSSIYIPFSLRLYSQERVRLDFYTKAGVRFQGVTEDYGLQKDLQANRSVGASVEPGLLVCFALSEKLHLQSGFTLPAVFEISPEFIFENNVTNLFANMGYKLSDKSLLMLKAGTDPAAGASGDSQKYTWSLQGGIRLLLGKNHTAASLIMEPSF